MFLFSQTFYKDNFFFETDLSELLLKNGLATVYKGGGAQYNGKKLYYISLEEQAMKRKKGIWSQSGSIETPAAYKKKTRLKSMEKQKLSMDFVPGGRRGIRRND